MQRRGGGDGEDIPMNHSRAAPQRGSKKRESGGSLDFHQISFSYFGGEGRIYLGVGNLAKVAIYTIPVVAESYADSCLKVHSHKLQP